MCARTYVKTKSGVLAQLFGAEHRDDVKISYNIAPTDAIPIVRMNPNRGKREWVTSRWGLVPRWSKDLKSAARCINARAETICDKPSFRDAFRKRRCMVIVDGFYEWKKEEKKRIPFALSRDDNAPLALAGLWELWQDKDEDSPRVRSSTIITCPANEDLEGLHHRMPVILDAKQTNLWLSDTEDHAALEQMLTMPREGILRRCEVGPAVNHVRATGPSLLSPVKSTQSTTTSTSNS